MGFGLFFWIQRCHNLFPLTKEYFFNQPTDISNIPVTVTDPYGQILDLNGMDFSFTLELKEITNSSVYESMRS